MKTLTKKEIVGKFNEMYKNSDYAIFVDYKGMNAEQTASFRGELRKNDNTRFFVLKNTLNKKSMLGTEFSVDENLLKGQCGVVFCNDLLKISKVVDKFCFKDNVVKFVACLNKSKVCSESEVKELASLPSMEVLRAKLVYLLNSTGSSFVRVLNEAVNKNREATPDGK